MKPKSPTRMIKESETDRSSDQDQYKIIKLIKSNSKTSKFKNVKSSDFRKLLNLKSEFNESIPLRANRNIDLFK